MSAGTARGVVGGAVQRGWRARLERRWRATAVPAPHPARSFRALSWQLPASLVATRQSPPPSRPPSPTLLPSSATAECCRTWEATTASRGRPVALQTVLELLSLTHVNVRQINVIVQPAFCRLVWKGKAGKERQRRHCGDWRVLLL
eukprot:365207-Chlamydomonas_euryale.AAC.6